MQHPYSIRHAAAISFNQAENGHSFFLLPISGRLVIKSFWGNVRISLKAQGLVACIAMVQVQ
jgi:hypothetical protein